MRERGDGLLRRPPCRQPMLREDGHPAYVCRRCDSHPGMDAVISDEAWRLIDGDRWGLLCLWCMDELAEYAGIQTMVALYFVGRALTSVLPQGSSLPHDWAVTHKHRRPGPHDGGGAPHLDEAERRLRTLSNSLSNFAVLKRRGLL